MKRQRIRTVEYSPLLDNDDDDDTNQHNFQMHGSHRPMRRENVLEAQIQKGDTLQAIALRYNCTISDIKRLNKIEKEIEIHARNTLKVPMNAQNLLLSTSNNADVLPIVHRSGQNSPKHLQASHPNSNSSTSPSNNRQLETADDQSKLDEKLLIASVSLATATTMNASAAAATPNTSQSHPNDANRDSFFNDPLLAHLDSGPHVIRGAPKMNDLTCSGSDCDISWICLLVCILALCFAIPLIYVIYIAEHPEKFNHTESL